MKHATEMDRLSRALATAADDRIRRAVAMVDAMPDRGQADGLVAPLRSRLARMRPARPLNFTRLLFLPLDPVIVPHAAWRRHAPGVPRTALAVLARDIRQGWKPSEEAELADIDARLASLNTGDRERVLAVGELLWANAASRLVARPPPKDWTAATGLAPEDFAPLARVVALVLTQGLQIVRLRESQDGVAVLDTELGSICGAALQTLADPMQGSDGDGADGKAALATLLACLILGSPRADRVLATAERLGGADKQQLAAGQLALEFVLARMVAATSEFTLAQAAETIGRAAETLASLDALMEFRPAPRQQLQEARRRLDLACRGRLAAALTELVGGGVAGPPERNSLARDASRFERAARRIGGADLYDRVLDDVVTRLAEPLDGVPDAAERTLLAGILKG